MRRNSDLSIRYPAYYRHDLLAKRREELGLSLQQVSRDAGVNFDSTRRAFRGTAGSKIVWELAQFLKMDWTMLHDFSIPESDFHLAVKQNGGRSVAG